MKILGYFVREQHMPSSFSNSRVGQVPCLLPPPCGPHGVSKHLLAVVRAVDESSELSDAGSAVADVVSATHALRPHVVNRSIYR